MAILKTRAIVLRRSAFRETSLRASLFTADFGKATFLVKGVRTAKPDTLSHFELFSEIELVFYAHFHSGMHLASESSLIDYHAPIRQDLKRFAWACHSLELLDTLLEVHDPHASLYEELRAALRLLEAGAGERVMRVFQVRALARTGFLPEFERCAECGRNAWSAAPNGSRILFSPQAGGILCSAHATQGGRVLALSGASLTVLRGAVRLSMEESAGRAWAGGVLEQVGRVLDAFVAWRTERELKCAGFLHRVGAGGGKVSRVVQNT